MQYDMESLLNLIYAKVAGKMKYYKDITKIMKNLLKCNGFVVLATDLNIENLNER